jgi:hypothetical protein
MDGIRSVLFFRFMDPLRLLGEAIAESMLCGNLSIGRRPSPFPPMRLHLPPGRGRKPYF